MSPLRKLSDHTLDFLDIYRAIQVKPETPSNLPRIRLNNVTSSMAFLYEKIRNAVDYKDNHLLRKNAIERILKRKMVVERRTQGIAKSIIHELIRARYLSNNKIPETKIEEVTEQIEKYLLLLSEIKKKYARNLSHKASTWIISLAACEIEESLSEWDKEEALAQYMYVSIKEDIVIEDEKIEEDEKNLQVYLAIHRALHKSDDAILRYHLFKLYYPDWKTDYQILIPDIVDHFPAIKRSTEKQIYHPRRDQIFRLIKKQAVFFNILNDTIGKNLKNENLTDSQLLKHSVRQAVKVRYKESQEKLRRSVLRAIIYILLTKTVLAFVLEVPYDLFFYQEIHYMPLIVNVVFHPFLLFIIAVMIGAPTKKNTEKIIQGVKGIVYGDRQERIVYRLNKSFEKGSFISIFFNVIYTIMFLISFGALVFMLYELNFNIASGILFVFFLSIVSFFSIRLRQNRRELMVEDEKGSFTNIFIDFLTLPVIRVGRQISVKFSKVNIFMYFLDFIIEAPFKKFLEVFEDLLSFLREKKEQIY